MYLLKVQDGDEGSGTFEEPILVSYSKEKIFDCLRTLPFVIIDESERIETQFDEEGSTLFTLNVSGSEVSFYFYPTSSFVIEEIFLL